MHGFSGTCHAFVIMIELADIDDGRGLLRTGDLQKALLLL